MQLRAPKRRIARVNVVDVNIDERSDDQHASCVVDHGFCAARVDNRCPHIDNGRQRIDNDADGCCRAPCRAGLFVGRVAARGSALVVRVGLR